MRIAPTVLLLAFAPMLAAADPLVETVTPNNALTAPPAEWLGETPHFVVMGTVDGHPFDVQFTDLATADIHALETKREYTVDADGTHYLEVDFSLQAVIDGVAKRIEGKVNHADFLTLALPATLDLQAEENPPGPLAFHEFEFEWEGDGTSVNAEVGGWAGTFVLEVDDAFGSAEPVGDGLSGGYISATLGNDTLVISFTLPIGEADVEE